MYNDLNGDGKHESSEPDLAGWTVDLLDSHGNVLASLVTDIHGGYAFAGVGPGTYEIAEVPQTNWVQTQPLFPTFYSFTAKSGVNLNGNNFGDHFAPALSPLAVIDNGQPGYAETGTWTTVKGGFNGTNRLAATTHGSTATATASWTFTGLAANQYDVYVTFAARPSPNPKLPFTVYDGTASLGTQSINESILVTQSQGGRAQGSYGGVGWLELGTFSITSGTLEVVLSNLASGYFVDADGVLIVPHANPAASMLVTQAPGGNTNPPIGTADFSQVLGANNSSKSSNSGQTTTPTVAISGVTQPVALNVVYGANPPAQASPTTPSIVDAILSQNGTSSNNGSSDALSSLAEDVVSVKNRNV